MVLQFVPPTSRSRTKPRSAALTRKLRQLEAKPGAAAILDRLMDALLDDKVPLHLSGKAIHLWRANPEAYRLIEQLVDDALEDCEEEA